MVRSSVLVRWLAGFVAVPSTAILTTACGGPDFAYALDASDTVDAPPSFDAADPSIDADTADAFVSRDGSSGADARSADAQATVTDARADAIVFDSGTSELMPSLGTGGPFVVLASAAVTNVGSGTILIGDIGTNAAVTGLNGHPSQPSGSTEMASSRATQALSDVGVAYAAIVGHACPAAHDLSGQDLGGLTLTPGVYCFSATASQLASSTLTFDAEGDPNAVWILQVATTLTILADAKAVIVGGPPTMACRIFWATGTSATFSSGSHFIGNVLASSTTSLQSGATLSPGRAFGSSGGVTLLDNTLSAAACQ